MGDGLKSVSALVAKFEQPKVESKLERSPSLQKLDKQGLVKTALAGKQLNPATANKTTTASAPPIHPTHSPSPSSTSNEIKNSQSQTSKIMGEHLQGIPDTIKMLKAIKYEADNTMTKKWADKFVRFIKGTKIADDDKKIEQQARSTYKELRKGVKGEKVSKKDVQTEVDKQINASKNNLNAARALSAKTLIQHLNKYPNLTTTEGLFRISGSHSKIGPLVDNLRTNPNYDKLPTLDDIHDTTGAIKALIREIDPPFFECGKFKEKFLESGEKLGRDPEKAKGLLKEALEELPKEQKELFLELMKLMAKIAQNEDGNPEKGVIGNKMNPSNLAIVIVPNFTKDQRVDATPEEILESMSPNNPNNTAFSVLVAYGKDNPSFFSSLEK